MYLFIVMINKLSTAKDCNDWNVCLCLINGSATSDFLCEVIWLTTKLGQSANMPKAFPSFSLMMKWLLCEFMLESLAELHCTLNNLKHVPLVQMSYLQRVWAWNIVKTALNVTFFVIPPLSPKNAPNNGFSKAVGVSSYSSHYIFCCQWGELNFLHLMGKG